MTKQQRELKTRRAVAQAEKALKDAEEKRRLQTIANTEQAVHESASKLALSRQAQKMQARSEELSRIRKQHDEERAAKVAAEKAEWCATNVLLHSLLSSEVIFAFV